MKRIKCILVFTLTFTLIFSTVGTTFAKASELEEPQIIYNQDILEPIILDISKPDIYNPDADDPDFEILEDGVFIDGRLYNPEEFEEYLNSVEIVELSYNDSEYTPQFSFTLAPGVYFIPGIGKVALLVTGGIVVAGVVISVGSWLYNIISSFFKDAKTVIATNYGIPKSLLDSNGKVKLGSFKDKYGNTPLTKNSGTFKNGTWSVEKDTAGHGGRAWKLKNNGKRVASLDKTGKVLSK